MSDVSVSSEESDQLSTVPVYTLNALRRSAQEEWKGAKRTSGVEREIHLFYCRRFCLTHENIIQNI